MTWQLRQVGQPGLAPIRSPSSRVASAEGLVPISVHCEVVRVVAKLRAVRLICLRDKILSVSSGPSFCLFCHKGNSLPCHKKWQTISIATTMASSTPHPWPVMSVLRTTFSAKAGRSKVTGGLRDSKQMVYTGSFCVPFKEGQGLVAQAISCQSCLEGL